MERIKEPATLISLTTGVAVACAAYYFLSRLNAMQEELDLYKRALADLINKVDGIDRRFTSSTKAIKGIREDLADVRSDLSTLDLPEAPAKRTLGGRAASGGTPRESSSRKRATRNRRDEEDDEAEGIMDAL